jgi:sulfhydrogenase subunit delta
MPELHSSATAVPLPRVAVHKFSSCDGCQLALLNAGEDLLRLAGRVEFVHFAEAGPVNPEAEADIALVEGSVATPEDLQRIQQVRGNSRYLITIGACATAGGLQALRNLADGDAWLGDVYASPEHVQSLATSTSIREHVKVDHEIWGCPVSGREVLAAIASLLAGAVPTQEQGKVCLECKRLHAVCVMVAKGLPCMGPVTHTGCGALCPTHGRDCYACYGPAENANTAAQGRRLRELGLAPEAVARRFSFIDSHAPEFLEAGRYWRENRDD